MTYLQRAQLWLVSIRQGFVALLPMLFLGALALTFIQLPLYFPSMQGMFAIKVGELVFHATYGLVSLFLVCSISYQIASSYKTVFDLRIDPFMVAMIAGVTLAIMLYMSDAVKTFSNFGFEHLIHALILGVVFTELLVAWVRFAPVKLSYLEHEINGQLSTVIRMILPAVVLPVILIVIYIYIFKNTDVVSGLMYWMIGSIDIAEGISYWQSIKVILVNQLSWFVGIHGTSVVGTVADNIFNSHNINNFNGEITSHFAYLGGSGCTLGLVMALLFSRRQSNRKFAKYAMIPSLFNINELIIFGLPIVLNRHLFLPFIVMPLVAMCLTAGAASNGLLDLVNHDVPWSMPFLLAGYLLTDDWTGAFMQLVICIVSALVYRPFIKQHEAFQTKKQSEKIKSFISEMQKDDFDIRQAMRNPDELGIFCRRIALDLHQKENFEMFYQPKLNHKGKVLGAEALIRWQHPVFGSLPPSVFIPIAEENESIHDLGLWVIERCFKDITIMDRTFGFSGVSIAINISPIQLTDTTFIEKVKSCIKRFGIDPARIEFEITEGQKLRLTDELVEGLQSLTNMGLSIAVDDFGMGHTSLHYLKSFPVHTIKIDGDLIRDVATSGLVQEIVQSMGQLAHGMNAVLVAEWVEQEAQLEILQKLGCDQYQGQYFSMPLPLAELVAYCVRHEK